MLASFREDTELPDFREVLLALSLIEHLLDFFSTPSPPEVSCFREVVEHACDEIEVLLSVIAGVTLL